MGADFNKIQQQKAMKNASRQDRKITKHAHRNVNSEWWQKKRKDESAAELSTEEAPQMTRCIRYNFHKLIRWWILKHI